MDMDMGNCKAYLNLDLDNIKSYVEAGLNALTSNLEMMYGVSGDVSNTKLTIRALKDVDYFSMTPCVICKAVKSDNNTTPFIVVFKQAFLREMINVVTGNMNGSTELVFDEFDLSTASEVISQVFNSFGSGLSLMVSKPIAAYNCECTVFNNYGDLIQAIKLGSDDQVLDILTNVGFEGYTANDINVVGNMSIIQGFLASLVKPKEEVPTPIVQETLKQAPSGDSNTMNPPISAVPNPNSIPVIKGETPVNIENTINNDYVIKDESKSLLNQPFTPANMQLLMNIPLEMSVKIGSTKKQVKEICEFTNGTVIELFKPISEHVDIYANDKMIAHGDVVVIDDNFGVQITEILDIKKIITAITGDE